MKAVAGGGGEGGWGPFSFQTLNYSLYEPNSSKDASRRQE